MSTQINVDMLKNDKPLKRYSETFKLKVLSELASGKYNKNEIQKVYAISTATIGDWLRKYNRLDLFNTVLKVESLEELERIKTLEKEMARLKELLVQKDIDNMVNKAYLEYAAKQLGYKSVDELKKKLNL